MWKSPTVVYLSASHWRAKVLLPVYKNQINSDLANSHLHAATVYKLVRSSSKKPSIEPDSFNLLSKCSTRTLPELYQTSTKAIFRNILSSKFKVWVFLRHSSRSSTKSSCLPEIHEILLPTKVQQNSAVNSSKVLVSYISCSFTQFKMNGYDQNDVLFSQSKYHNPVLNLIDKRALVRWMTQFFEMTFKNLCFQILQKSFQKSLASKTGKSLTLKNLTFFLSRTPQVTEAVQGFILNKHYLSKIQKVYEREINLGFCKTPSRPSSLLMAKSMVPWLPNGQEIGDFLSIDLGRQDPIFTDRIHCFSIFFWLSVFLFRLDKF